MSRRRTVDPSTLLDPNWQSTANFPLPPPDGASPVRLTRPSLIPESSTPAPLRLTPEVEVLATPPRRFRVNVEETLASPMSPRGAPDGRVEEDVAEERESGDCDNGRSFGDVVRRQSYGGGRTETEDDDDEDYDSEEDDGDDEMYGDRSEDQDPLSCSGLPKTFELALSYEDRFEAYVYDILGNATVDQVHRLFKGYMEENILPNGWLGLWRSGGVFGDEVVGEASASVLVEIENVSIVADDQKLDATATVSLPTRHGCDVGVVVNHPGSPNSSMLNRSWSVTQPGVKKLTQSEVETTLTSKEWRVPLLDIHPIFQRHGGAKLTAFALEHVRFFYKNIWRTWDSDIAKDEPYASQCLQSRMTLYYDMEEGKVNPEDQEKYEKTISQYEDVRTRLKALHDSMDVSDSDTELDEADVAQVAALYEREMALETAIQTLENPLLRFLQHDANFSNMKRQMALRLRGGTTEPVIHVVAKRFRARMAQSMDPDALIEHHPTLTSAMENFCTGDIIHIHEGIYSGVSLRSVANETVIKGVSPKTTNASSEKSSEVTPQSTDSKADGDNSQDNKTATDDGVNLEIGATSSVFVDVDPGTQPVTISDLTLRHLARHNGDTPPTKGNVEEESPVETVCVKRGILRLRDVVISSRSVAISVREGAFLELKNVTIQCATLAAIVAHPNANLVVEDVVYQDCGKLLVKSSKLGVLPADQAVLVPDES